MRWGKLKAGPWFFLSFHSFCFRQIPRGGGRIRMGKKEINDKKLTIHGLTE